MAIIEINGIQIDVDEDGFIQDPGVWNEDLAFAIAQIEEVENLTSNLNLKPIHLGRNSFRIGTISIVKAIKRLSASSTPSFE